jgi:alkylhydroperoxidase family enzyme
MLAHNPQVGGAVLRLIHAILAKADLDFGIRELAILRIAQRCQAQYVWTQHAAIARSIGISETQIHALQRGEATEGLFSVRERTLISFIDRALDYARVPDETFAMAQKEFTSRELMELLLTIGYFRMICSLLTTLDIELDEPRAIELLGLADKVA